MNQLDTKEYKYYFDYLRVIASLMVIMIHVSVSYMINDIVGANLPFFSHLNLVTGVSTSVRSAVPIFL